MYRDIRLQLSLRELVLLHFLVSYNCSEHQRLSQLPVLSRPSAARLCSITMLWSKAEPENSPLNRFIRESVLGIGYVLHSEQVYRSADKLREAGLLYPEADYQPFVPTERGNQIGLWLMNTRPLDWPTYVPYESGRTNWDHARWPLPISDLGPSSNVAGTL